MFLLVCSHHLDLVVTGVFKVPGTPSIRSNLSFFNAKINKYWNNWKDSRTLEHLCDNQKPGKPHYGSMRTLLETERQRLLNLLDRSPELIS